MFKSVNGGKLPTRGTKYSACVDVYANEDVVIRGGETKLITLGIKIDTDYIKELFTTTELHTGKSKYGCALDTRLNKEKYNNFMSTHYLQLMLRSSLGVKGLVLPNGVGVVDLDFKGQLQMLISNVSMKSVFIPLEGYTSVGDYFTVENYTHLVKKGDRIGQITLLEHKSNLFNITTEETRDGGFGSTDKD